MIHIISLGAGVQSSAMALMAAAGEISPMPACAIFADTGDEPQGVYTWLEWLKANLPFPVHTVSVGKVSDMATEIRVSKKSGNSYTRLGLPVYTIGERGKGMGMRQCTRTAKIDPIRRKLREVRGGHQVIQWIGISHEEYLRCKLSRDKWIENRWPLIDLKITRQGCLTWMEKRGYPKPPRSACVFCPFHNDSEWRRLKTEEPREFQKAVDFEKRIQTAYLAATALSSTPYLHASRKPLAEVDFTPHGDSALNLFNNECEGMCGV